MISVKSGVSGDSSFFPGRGQWRGDADVVVVGSGAAGIAVALTAAGRGLRVLVVTKDLVGGATPLAQGGLAAALGEGDTTAAHASDTLVAGAGLCEPDVVAALADGAPGAIDWLTRLGAQLETRDLRLEGGHSARRIVHSGDDATGAEVHRALLAALLASGVEILDRTVALELLGSGGTDRAGIGAGESGTDGDGTASANAGPDATFAQVPVPARMARQRLGRASLACGLAAASIGADGRLTPGVISARAVVIAAGGLGQAFGTTSNPEGATGDGVAIAARAGAVIRDLEFVQFHPTVLWLPGASGQCPLITEALRGAGAVLRDLDGTPLMAGHDPRGDLAPRDVVAARMAEVIAAGTAGHVWLDATGLGADVLEDGFPTVTAACRKHGIDPVTEMIPVAPGAHYSCGGILADLDGRTTLPGLYAVGEAASTGVQGANRLASNSVTEAIIAGRRAGAAIAGTLSAADGDAASPARAAARPAAHAAGAGAALPPSSAPGSPTLAGVQDYPERERVSRLRPVPPLGTQAPASPQASAATMEAAVSADEPVTGGAGARVRTRRLALAQDMSRYAGVMRDGDRLTKLIRVIMEADGITGSAPTVPVRNGAGEESAATVRDPLRGDLDLEAVEAANLRTVSLLIVAGALRRAESRGCHRRRDAAGTAAAPWHTLLRWDGRRLMVTEEEL
jgi:L-aspartate oxidase